MRDELRYRINNDSPEERERSIQQLFDSIVFTYDLLNRILSFGIDLRWRRSLVGIAGDMRNKNVLDMCCGTGDLSRLLYDKGACVFSLDFSIPMILKGIEKSWIKGWPVSADACRLPFKDKTFHFITIAFGVRNIPDIKNFVSEAVRVVKPKGRLIILELTRPDNIFIGFIYKLYLTKLLPLLGGVISGNFRAYRYLSRTISTFIDPVDLREMLISSGFKDIKFFRKTFGVAAIIVCVK